MAFLTIGTVNLAIGTATRSALCNTAGFVAFEAMARAEVQSAAQVAGYSLGNTSTNGMVQWLTLGQWYVKAAMLRKGIEPPEMIRASIADLELVRKGEKPIPGVTPSTEDGIGGTQFSSTSEDDADGRIQHFSRTKMSTW